MHLKRTLSIFGILTLVLTMVFLLSACQGEESGTVISEETEAPAEPTPDPADEFPEFLVLHPDAFDIDITEVSGTYVYYVPMMVKEITEYLLAEHEAKGWEKLGNPTIMGHLATLTMKMGDDRLTISMQDNELSESTRVQILLMQQLLTSFEEVEWKA